MNCIWPSFSQPTGLNTQFLSSDPEVERVRRKDPLLHNRVSARLFMSGFEAAGWALEHAFEFLLPLLIMHGSEDRFTSVKASRKFVEKVPGDATFKLWEGFYHDLHNEPQQKEVFNFLLLW